MQAIKSLVSVDAFTTDTGRQLRAVMPAILQNLYSESSKYLAHLQTRENAREEYDKELQLRRRTSLAIQRNGNSPDVDPSAVTGTIADADERSNDDIGVLALQSLRKVFSTDNPGQLRIATQCILGFIARRAQYRTSRADSKEGLESSRVTWSIDLFSTACRWTQVQYRYVVLVAATDTLTRSPTIEDDLPNQLVVTRIIDALLRSSITFIGLSVNDVLIGFVQHVLLLLQLGGRGSKLQPHRQQTEAFGLLRVDSNPPREVSPASGHGGGSEVVTKPSALRMQLLDELQEAIGDLATHIYYADQTSEMVAALLLRLKPPTPAIPTVTSAIEDPNAAAAAIVKSGHLLEKPQADDFFSFDTARMLALGAVKKIMVVANARRNRGIGAGAANRVGVSIWDGTQWLLCDPDGRVRKAYVDALLTWMISELDKSSLRIVEELPIRNARAKQQDGPQANGSIMARRAVSNASKTNKMNLQTRSPFLQLLHLAIYENAIQYAESESDMLLLHLLLISMIQKLGVNAVRHGLPMIFRLQEDITTVKSPTAKDAIGSLVHGYFWCLTEFFDFDTAIVGRDIANEISRRSQLGLWLSPISVPAVPLEKISVPANTPSRPRPMSVTQRTQSLVPFTDRRGMVSCIVEAYSTELLSPPSSPPISPRRPASAHSTHSRRPSNFPILPEKQLPASVKQQMLAPWTREACISDVDGHDGRTRSLTGSKSGSGSGRGGGLLAVDGGAAGGINGTSNPSPRNQSDVDLARGVSQRRHPHSPIIDGVPRTADSARATTIVRVSDLKRTLETGGVDLRSPRKRFGSDAESESMMSAADVSSLT